MPVEFWNPKPIGYYDVTQIEKENVFAEIKSKKQIIDSLYESYTWNDHVSTTFNKDKNIFYTHNFIECFSLVHKYTLQYLSESKIDYQNSISLTNSWFNKTVKHGYQSSHSHIPYFVSGVYYYDLNTTAEQHEPLLFNIQDDLEIYSTKKESSKVIYQYVPGRIIIFPSYLHHSVGLKISDDERYSFSFNFSLCFNV